MVSVKNHSYSNYEEVKISHAKLNLKVDFESKTLAGFVTYTFKNEKEASNIILDFKQLNIQKTAVNGKEVSFEVGEEKEFIGKPLIIPIEKNSTEITIWYKTTPESGALQWLNPSQTHDKKEPFLFSQSQAILCRTWIPIMDAPAIRFTYEADITCPPHLMALMSAKNPQKRSETGQYHFVQDKPIPSYLMALAVGDIGFQSIGRNTGVYAEKNYLNDCAWELNQMQSMLDSAEELYGKYTWDRYDVLVLPPSFPFGGMENPMLTFATPTIIAKDRSLVSLVAHELAHSWSGNLVTNETWDDFWLNEGFTVYFEQRIMEKIYGENYADMETALARTELQETVEDLLKNAPDDTKLKLNLAGRDPDDGLSDIAYEKGRFFLRSIEKTVGRIAWDNFLNKYFKKFAFSTTNTDKFIEYLEKELLSNNKQWANEVNYKEWIFEKGLPKNCETIKSIELEEVDEALSLLNKNFDLNAIDTEDWTTHHWLYFLRNIKNITADKCKKLDAAFEFSKSNNAEILCDWFLISIKNKYDGSKPAMENFLASVGRRKFILPIYETLVKNNEKGYAQKLFESNKNAYHSVTARSVAELFLEKKQN